MNKRERKRAREIHHETRNIESIYHTFFFMIDPISEVYRVVITIQSKFDVSRLSRTFYSISLEKNGISFVFNHHALTMLDGKDDDERIGIVL